MSGREDSEHALARRLRLRGESPPVVRLSRRAIVLLAGASVVSIAGITGWGLSARRAATPTDAAEAATAPAATTPPQIADLPKDYAAPPADVPRLGPPLPGDLGRPMVAAASSGVEGGGAGDTAQRQAEEEAKQARTSRLFEATSARPSAATTTVSTDPMATTVARSAARARPSAPDAQSGQTPGKVLQAGSVIRAALITGVRSEVPGLVEAQVTEDVFDSATGRWRLIPQGARLIGSYERQPEFGESRLAVVWTRLIFPDGRSVDLPREPAADPQGYAGLTGRVDRHWRQLAGAAAVSTLLGVGSELGVGSSDSQVVQALRFGVAGSLNQAGGQLVGKSLGVNPTVTIAPGSPVRVLLTRDLLLEPWEARP